MRYLLLRLAWFFPTLFGLSLLVMLLSAEAPLNPLEKRCQGGDNPIGQAKAYRDCLENLHHAYQFDLPVFYFGLRTLAEPSHFAAIADRKERRARQALTHHYGNGQAVARYFAQLDRFLAAAQALINQVPPSGQASAGRAIVFADQLFKQPLPTQLDRQLLKLADSLYQNPVFAPLRLPFDSLRTTFNQLEAEATPWKSYVPWLAWHGTQCRYHQWVGNFLRGDWGVSLSNPNSRVADRIRHKVGYSLFFSLTPILLIFVLALPLGVWAAQQQGSRKDRLTGLVLFSLDAIPSFWMALILLYLFASSNFLKLFEPGFLQGDADQVPLDAYILPLIAYTYGGLAYLSRLTRANLLEVLQLPYMRTARAKGLPAWRIYWLHGLRSAALPLVTLLAGIFPALISGSVILERIFTIPGIGQLILKVATENDLPTAMAIFTLIALLTAIGYLVADLLYAWIDPRIRLGKR